MLLLRPGVSTVLHFKHPIDGAPAVVVLERGPKYDDDPVRQGYSLPGGFCRTVGPAQEIDLRENAVRASAEEIPLGLVGLNAHTFFMQLRERMHGIQHENDTSPTGTIKDSPQDGTAATSFACELNQSEADDLIRFQEKCANDPGFLQEVARASNGKTDKMEIVPMRDFETRFSIPPMNANAGDRDKFTFAHEFTAVQKTIEQMREAHPVLMALPPRDPHGGSIQNVAVFLNAHDRNNNEAAIQVTRALLDHGYRMVCGAGLEGGQRASRDVFKEDYRNRGCTRIEIGIEGFVKGDINVARAPLRTDLLVTKPIDAIIAVPGGTGLVAEYSGAIDNNHILSRSHPDERCAPIIFINPNDDYDPMFTMYTEMVANNRTSPGKFRSIVEVKSGADAVKLLNLMNEANSPYLLHNLRSDNPNGRTLLNFVPGASAFARHPVPQ